MIQGQEATLHAQTVCHLIAEKSPLHEKQCMIQSFDQAKGKWIVQLGSGKKLLVLESTLRVSFCLLPSSTRKLQLFVRVGKEDQGSCGRGLAVQEAVPAGHPIFSEPPLIVAGGLVGGTKHSERWQAYATLRSNAKLEGCADGPVTQALQAFESLGIGEHIPSSVREAAEAIAKQQSAHTEDVFNALARFHTNSFRLHNGVEVDSPTLTCSGLYDYISRTNHSCEPSIAIVPKSTFCGWRGVPWTLADSGGVLIAYALRDLRAGESVSFNYGPDEMLTERWDVHRRRAHLKAKLGFLCGCPRCTSEAAAEEVVEEVAEEVLDTEAVVVVHETEASVLAATCASGGTTKAPLPAEYAGGERSFFASPAARLTAACGVAIALLMMVRARRS